MRYELDIRRDEIHLVAAAIDVFDGEVAYEDALARVSEHRRAKVRSYRFERDRRLSLLVGLLLGELLRERGLCECDMAYNVSDLGKPMFAAHPELHYSLAHSGELAVAVLADTPVGADVERLADFPHDIADPHEWTQMESVGKLLGTGVGGYVDSGAFRMPEGIQTEHFEIRGHLVCFAREARSPLQRFGATMGQTPDDETEFMMAIAKTVDGTQATLAIDGWLDTQSAPELAAVLDELGDGVEELVLDLAALEYVSSAGIRQIVAAHKKMGGRLVVRNVAPEVLEVFRLTGVDSRLNIE